LYHTWHNGLAHKPTAKLHKKSFTDEKLEEKSIIQSIVSAMGLLELLATKFFKEKKKMQTTIPMTATIATANQKPTQPPF
jgi:hypothetical protein